MMRVLYVNHSCVLQINQTRLAKLAELPGIEVAVLAPTWWRERDVDKTYAFEHPGETSYKVYPTKAYLAFHPNLYFYYPPALQKVIEDFKPELIHIEQEPFSLCGFQLVRAGKRRGVKLVMTTLQNLDKRYPLPFRIIERHNLKSIDHLIAGTEQIRRLWQKRAGRDDTLVIPLGYDPAKFHPQDCSLLRARLNLKGFVIGYLGRLIEAKGLATLLQAAAKLNSELSLLVDGRGPYKTTMIELARELELEDNLVFVDPSHDEVPDYINCMDVLVLPSFSTPRWTEQFGRVLVEAMACGVPVIGSSSGAIPGVIGDAGLIFEERNAEYLTCQLKRLMDDTALRHELSRRGIERALTEFTWAKVVQRMYAVYQQCFG